MSAQREKEQTAYKIPLSPHLDSATADLKDIFWIKWRIVTIGQLIEFGELLDAFVVVEGSHKDSGERLKLWEESWNWHPALEEPSVVAAIRGEPKIGTTWVHRLSNSSHCLLFALYGAAPVGSSQERLILSGPPDPESWRMVTKSAWQILEGRKTQNSIVAAEHIEREAVETPKHAPASGPKAVSSATCAEENSLLRQFQALLEGSWRSAERHLNSARKESDDHLMYLEPFDD